MRKNKLIHTYKLNGYNIVIDICSGAVHLFDDTAYDVVNLLEREMVTPQCPHFVINQLNHKYSAKTILESYNDIFELFSNGLLFTVDDYGEIASNMGPAPIKSMCINIAHDCNLKCEYCFAAQGDFGKGKKLMPFEVAKKAIDFLIDNSGSRYNLEVDFFGGEPLMNFDVVKKTVEYSRSLEKEHNKNFRFTITTNGILLNDDIIYYINKEMSNVVLSLDGRKKVHDRLRKTVNNQGSYDIIVDKYRKLIRDRKNRQYYVRGTFTKYNLDFTNDILHFYDDLGFDQISIEPVIADEKVAYSISESDLNEIFSEYEKLAQEIIKRKRVGESFNFFHFMIDLEQGPCAIKRLRGCSCGNEYIAVTPEGDIYPCHQFVGDEKWKMGSVIDGRLNKKIKEDFSKANVYAKQECRNCWARFYCSGGCNANNYQFNSNILIPHKLSCNLEKKRIECAIMLKVALS